MRTRNGKIARLPRHVREQLNERLERSEPSPALLDWLNALPEVRPVLGAEFNGEPISKQNLSQWRRGGFQEWLARQELWDDAREVDDFADEWETERETMLADRVATVLAARFASLIGRWDGQCTQEFEARARVLNGLCRAIVQLQRTMHQARRESFDFDRQVEQREKEQTQEQKARLMGAVMGPLQRGQLARMLGGGEQGLKLAELIQTIQQGRFDKLDHLKPLASNEMNEDAEQSSAKEESQPVKVSNTDSGE